MYLQRSAKVPNYLAMEGRQGKPGLAVPHVLYLPNVASQEGELYEYFDEDAWVRVDEMHTPTRTPTR